MKQETHDIAVEAIKGTPAVVGAIASAVTLNHLLMLTTLLYVVVQVAYLLRKWWREERDREREIAREDRDDIASGKLPVERR